MKALNDYLILKKDGRERVTESGIILPDFGSENDNLGKPYTGVIQSKGWDVSDKYGVGDRVRHFKFGAGTVTNIVKEPRDYKVTVDFDAHGTKVMYASFAKLVKE